MVPDDATPTVDCLIALAMAEHPGVSRTAQAEYYEAVHQELAPLARQLERETRKLRQQLRKLREDVLSVMPENWREDPDWVALADNQKLSPEVGAGDTVTLHQRIRSAQIAAGEDAVTANLRSMGLLPNAKVSGPEAALSPEGRARLPGSAAGDNEAPSY